jgi:divalent metal cation (Fe/Co/Zn/Cd) transporter
VTAHTAHVPLPHGSPQWQRAARRAKRLSWLSLLYMGAEGATAVTAAVLAGSVALLGFGIDSAIEAIASIIIVWRFTGSRTLSETAERRAQIAVAVSFWLLAPYIAYEAISKLAGGHHPQTSWLGIGIAAFSLTWMPVLGVMKKHLGAQLGSEAVAGEGTQNLLCAYLATGVLAGLLANTVLGWWWLDPLIALVIAALAVWEGIEAWRGEG